MVNDTLETKEAKRKKGPKRLKEKKKPKRLKESKDNDQKEKKKKIPKEISQEILRKMFGNIVRAIGIMLYFMILNLAYSAMKQERLVSDIEVFAGAFLIVGIVLLERAYQKDSNTTAIDGIECLVLSLHSLSIMHIITLFKYDFRFYLLSSSYIFSIYYVFKAIILYTKGRREYLKSLSDISEIVKKEEPVKKEAKKRTKTSRTSSAKRTTTKTKATKVKKKEEIQAPEKKKRGRPKKEVTKND